MVKPFKNMRQIVRMNTRSGIYDQQAHPRRYFSQSYCAATAGGREFRALDNRLLKMVAHFIAIQGQLQVGRRPVFQGERDAQ